jgi:DNA sulfur modification protein DndD
MLIRRVILENFGLYQDKQEFDLVPREKYGKTRPIILIGGKNGTGKTTLLEAVRLALYGRSALGSRVRQVDYDAYLRARIHRSRGNVHTVEQAAVAVEFDYVRVGEKKTYQATRSWRPCGNRGVEETFTLLEGGKPIQDLDQDLAEAFAREIVPEGLSQLFFFDGEKIRDLAEDQTGDGVLAESIKALLGLDTVERLSADLSIYASRKTAELADEDDQVKLLKLNEDLVTVTKEQKEIEKRIQALQVEIEAAEDEASRAEEQLRCDGHNYSKRREHWEAKLQWSKREIDSREAELRLMCEGLLPFALCPNTVARLRVQMELEAEQQRQKLLNVEIEDIAKELLSELHRARKHLSHSKTGKVSDVGDKLIETAQAYLRRRADKNTPIEGATFLRLSPSETEAIIGILDQAESITRATAERICRELERTHRELGESKKSLARIPSDDVIGPLMQKLQEVHQRLGTLRQKQKQVQEEQHSLALHRQDLDRRRQRIEESINNGDDNMQKITLVGKVRSALEDYLLRLTERKIEDLRRSVVECFGRLARKRDLVNDIKIDPRTFEVILHDRSGGIISKAELSSGEKQIFAISMLWGLARTSGRPLPVIIDTPLGRLDKDHRQNLCNNYLPHASHQVILLSTDTEVEQQMLTQLSPNISHSYLLEFDHATERTTASEGYFWRETANV